MDNAEDYDLNRHYEPLSLDDFYSELTEFKLTDEDAISYMTFAAKNACVKFDTTEEMLQFKGDFQAALAFIGKLDEVDVKGVEPLGNIFEHYGGNELKMRSTEEFGRARNLTFTQKEFIAINAHSSEKDGGYSVIPSTKVANPDYE